MRYIYPIFALLGLVVPYYFFISFLVEYGMDFQLFFDFLFANPISAFFTMDLVLAAMVTYVYLYRESRRIGIENWWIYVVLSLVVGLSFAFPIFLYARDKKLS